MYVSNFPLLNITLFNTYGEKKIYIYIHEGFEFTDSHKVLLCFLGQFLLAKSLKKGISIWN
jgi:tryptophan synthase beta subunit